MYFIAEIYRSSYLLPSRFTVCALAFLVCCMGSLSQAELRLESLLVSANAPRSAGLKLVEPVTLISAEQISAQQANNLNQVLSGIGGVYASREGGPGGVNSLSIRGAEPNFTVVLIDDVAVNDPTNTRGGSFDLATLSVASLTQVELIRGPQSLIYGADALAGVVKLSSFPSAAQARSGLHALYEYREGGAYRSFARATLAGDDQFVALQGAKEDSADVYAGDGVDSSALQLNEKALHYAGNFDDYLQVQLGARESEFAKHIYPEQSGGPEFAANSDQDRSDGSDQTASISTRLALGAQGSLVVQFTDYQRELDYHSPGIAPYDNVPANAYRAEYSRSQWRLIGELFIGALNINVGADRRWEDGISEGDVTFSNVPVDALGFLLGLPSLPLETGLSLPLEVVLATDYRLRRTTEGKFVQANWQSDGGIVVSAGVRRDEIGKDSETIPRYLLRVPIGDDVKLTASYSEGYKSPSFFALGHGLVGNAELRPERADSYQLEFDWQLTPQWLWQVSLFDTHYRDLIDFDAEQFTNVNRSRVNSEGGEIALRWQHGNWQASAALSMVDIEFADDGESADRHLANRPEKLARMDIHWQPTDSISWFGQWLYVDQQFATSLHSGETREYRLDDYSLLNTAIRWQALPQLLFSAAVDNILDQDYDEAVGFPGPGRVVRAGVEFTF